MSSVMESPLLFASILYMSKYITIIPHCYKSELFIPLTISCLIARLEAGLNIMYPNLQGEEGSNKKI